jgi:DNA ligase (NAD+)
LSFGDVDKFFEAIDVAKDTNGDGISDPFPLLTNQLGIGPVVIDSLAAFSKNDELVIAAKNLAKSINVIKEVLTNETDERTDTSEDTKPWKGFRVVFTGSLEGLTRSDAQKLAKDLGAKATPESVSKSTDLVVFGDKGGKKLDQARSLGIRTLTADEFMDMVKTRGLFKEVKPS